MNIQTKQKFLQIATESFIESIKTKNKIIADNQLLILIKMAEIITKSIKNGGKLLLCGNGGSAADAQHLATELLVRLRPQVNRQPIPAISLAIDTSMITATGNDYSFDEIFTRPLAGLGKIGDVLLGITTSGKSPNVLAAYKLARSMSIVTLGFLGGTGGLATELCDEKFIVPSNITARIQESHITAGHVLMELVEEMLIEDRYITKLENKVC